jgi:glycosyltransferase involved in cell wall biosynthesis
MENTDVDDTIFGKLNLKNDEEYFFSLGSKYKHKNFKWVIAAARKNPSYKFVITGTGAFSNNESQLQQNTPENVIFTGYISNEEIKSLMAHCKALIQPSLYEGFGLPPLEALSVGAPIIVSNTSCLPEIYKQAAHYIDPYADGCDLENLLREKVGNSADILKEYSWEHAAKQLIEVMNKFR